MKFIAICFAIICAIPALAQPVLLSDIEFAPNGVGGLSALELNSDGTTFHVLADRGQILTGTLLRDGDRISGYTVQSAAPIRDTAGRSVTGRNADSEGIAIRTDGRIFVSFERNHRIWAYDAANGAALVYTPAADFARLPNNQGLEALAIAPNGHLIAIPEANTGPVPIYDYGTEWQIAQTIPVPRGYHVTGADFGPDGLLYLLERRFTGLSFSTRLTRVGPTGEYQLILATPLGTHGNLEGLSVWRDQSGRLRATMVSDNNESIFTRSQLVEYAIGQ